MNDSLEIELPIPLRCERLDSSPAQSDNSTAFTLINSFAEPARVRGEEESEAGELHRIEKKLDLIVQLILPLLRGQQPLPKTHNIRISVNQIAWQPTEQVEKDQWMQFHLFLEPRVPYPVVLNARVTGTDGPWTCASFQQLGESDTEALERWIFRYHRRQVAKKRQRSSRS